MFKVEEFSPSNV